MSRLARFARIMHIIGRYRLDEFIPMQRARPLPRFILKLSPLRLYPDSSLNRGQRLRKAMEDLGPVFIKFGQLLSTRRDLLPDDIADELAKLQDDVPPFDSEQAVTIIESALGQPVDQLFSSFEPTPMASASVAQVHAATLLDGTEVVVKVVRPGIESTIRQDIALLFVFARLIRAYLPDGKRLRPVEVVADYELTILDELDLGREASNASQLRRNFQDSNLVYIPEVFWDFTRRNVYTMERIRGVPVTDLATLRDKGTDLKLLAERGVNIFFTQVFRDSFFHADMHPGNIFVDISNPDDPTYIAVDCAIIGSLSDFDQYYLARNLLAIFQRDYRQVAQLHVECGWVPAGTRVQDFEAAMRAVCEPVFERPLSEISFGQLLIYLFNTARRFDMAVQPSLVLLQKTLLNIEGLGRELYPQLNLWDTAQPFLENWVEERYSPQGVLQRMQRNAPSWLEALPEVPDALLDGLKYLRHIEQYRPQQQAQQQRSAARAAGERKRRSRLLVGSALLLVAAVSARPEIITRLAEAPILSWILAAAGVILLWRGLHRD